LLIYIFVIVYFRVFSCRINIQFIIEALKSICCERIFIIFGRRSESRLKHALCFFLIIFCVLFMKNSWMFYFALAMMPFSCLICELFRFNDIYRLSVLYFLKSRAVIYTATFHWYFLPGISPPMVVSLEYFKSIFNPFLPIFNQLMWFFFQMINLIDKRWADVITCLIYKLPRIITALGY
jgi:hypothetical protein